MIFCSWDWCTIWQLSDQRDSQCQVNLFEVYAGQLRAQHQGSCICQTPFYCYNSRLGSNLYHRNHILIENSLMRKIVQKYYIPTFLHNCIFCEKKSIEFLKFDIKFNFLGMGCVSGSTKQKQQKTFQYDQRVNQTPKITNNKSQEPQIQNRAIKTTLNITNKSSKYSLKYGKQFRQLLQSRDQVLEHQFDFSFNLNIPDFESQVYQNELYNTLEQKIKEFLVEAVSNVVSAGFKFLCKGQLEQKQAKDYTAKNIMVNLRAIHQATVKALKINDQLRQRIDIQRVEKILIVEMDNVLNNILINLSDNYPQAPAMGGTLRMREIITEVNRTQNQQNDFIVTSGIKINDFLNKKGSLNQDGDYTTFIMKVINEVIKITQNSQDDHKQRTVFQKFTQFNEYLFWLSQQKRFHQIMNNMDKKNKSHKNETTKQKREIEKEICKKFDKILNNEDKQTQILNSKVKSQIDKFWQIAEDGISQMKMKKTYALGQKIPSFVKVFNRQEIQNKQFSAKHSSILRIMTKWAGYLEQIFQNPEAYLQKRVYPFKNLDNESTEVVSWNKSGIQKLIKGLSEQYKIVKQKFLNILQTSYSFIGKFLSEQHSTSIVSSVFRYTQTRKISSKVNSVLTSLMLDYTNILIHHLLKAGQNIKTPNQTQNINLIVFRISDLMRSKYQCSETTFINLLKTMYILDDNSQMQDIFKLVRTKIDQMALPMIF